MRRTVLLLTTAVLAFSAMLPAGASASTQPAAGTFTEGPETITDERFADGNLILELTREVVFTGAYTGGGEAKERIVIHKDGSTNVHIVVSFTGLACGVPATLEFLIVGQGQLDENFETGTIAGSYSILRNGFAHGNGTFEGQAGVGGTYEGQAHCA
jgi:hypothetical protein